MPYSLEFHPSAVKQLIRLPDSIRERIEKEIFLLEREPRPAGAIKMSGCENRYRIRTGDYRVIYEIHDKRLIVVIVRIGHRRDVYR
ncbi:MAG: type II toxin-antitoxin system RelE/ParE family toxin [Candidatus Sumerlaeota bacterium]|nr:type II toxin-antitoxin system RelE/ParE family toxin [Candidatus Sumerlaeota bacterium]